MHGRGEGGAIDKESAIGVLKEIVFCTKKDGFHGGVIGDYGEYDIGLSGDFGKGGSMGAANFLGEGGGCVMIYIMDAANVVSFVLKIAGHVGPHTANADEANFLFLGVHSVRFLSNF